MAKKKTTTKKMRRGVIRAEASRQIAISAGIADEANRLGIPVKHEGVTRELCFRTHVTGAVEMWLVDGGNEPVFIAEVDAVILHDWLADTLTEDEVPG